MTRSRWVTHLFRPLVAGTMVGCIAVSLVDLVRLFAPTWNGTYMVVGSVLAALEAGYSYQLVRARRLRGADLLRFRAIELALFFVTLKIGGTIGDRWADVVADLKAWPRQPWAVFDPETSIAFLLAFLAWSAATQTTLDLERIGEPPLREHGYVPPIASLTSRFFQGGAVLMILAGVTRIGLAALLDLRRPSVPGIVLNVLLYFVLGLAMLGQVQFTRLHQRWQAQEIQVTKGLPGRWAGYSLALIGLAAAVAFLLPTGYTVGLLDVVATVIGGVFYVVNLVIQILLSLVALLAMALAAALGDQHPTLPEIAPASPAPLQLGPTGAAAPGWFEILRSLLFWAAALAMLYYVVRSYLRDRPELLEGLAALRPIRSLQKILAALWHRLVGWMLVARRRISLRPLLRRTQGKPAATAEPSHAFRPGASSPRQRILHYYLSILHRAGQQGFPRRRAQTPYEYDVTLTPHLPEAHREMDRLTEFFIEARYSQHAVDKKEAQQARADWRRVRDALQALQETDGGRSKDE